MLFCIWVFIHRSNKFIHRRIFFPVGVFYCSKVCLQYFVISFRSALIFRVPSDNISKTLVMKMLFWIWVCIHRSSVHRVIQFHQVGVFYCSQLCLKYFKIMDYKNTRQSKKISYFMASR